MTAETGQLSDAQRRVLEYVKERGRIHATTALPDSRGRLVTVQIATIQVLVRKGLLTYRNDLNAWVAATSSTEDTLICRIADRAVELGLFDVGASAAAMISFCHRRVQPLRLQELLYAKNFDFVHDVAGIAKHLSRDTPDLGGFLPRYSQRTKKEGEPR